MAAVDCIPPINSNGLFDWKFKCDFCPVISHTEDSFNSHVLEHFVKKNCLECNKSLLRIGSEWYELHIDWHETQENQTNSFEAIAEIKVENRGELEPNDRYDDIGRIDNHEAETVFCEESSSASTSSNESQPQTNPISTKNRKIKKNRPNERVQTEPKLAQTVAQSHVQSRRKGRLPRIKCRICERIILKYNFEAHLVKMHVPRVITSKEPVKCETCGKSFANNGNLKIHQAIHSGTKRFGNFRFQMYHLIVYFNGCDLFFLFFYFQFVAIAAPVFGNFII